MIKNTVTDAKWATHCTKCGQLLTNPGYGRNKKQCCGVYQQWWKWITETRTWDDGRDERGRFHHKPEHLGFKVRQA